MTGISNVQMLSDLVKRQVLESEEIINTIQAELFNAQNHLKKMESQVERAQPQPPAKLYVDASYVQQHYQSMVRLQNALNLQTEVIEAIIENLVEETDHLAQLRTHLQRLEDVVHQRQEAFNRSFLTEIRNSTQTQEK
jgi:uncharacterized coiled-coil protein SlyX